MLEAVLQPSSPIASLELLDTEIPGELTGDKAIRLDVRSRSDDGSLLNIEMQAQGHPAFPERMLFYWARGYTESLGRGQTYSLLRPSISIIWSTVKVVPTDRFHNVYLALERASGHRLSDHFQLHLLQLPFLASAPNTPKRLARWARFLGAASDQEFDTLAKEHPSMANAVKEPDRISSDPLARRRAQEREDSIRMYEHSLAISRLEGEAEGKLKGEAEGKLKGKAELVLKLLTLRFGALNEAHTERVRGSSAEELDALSERVLTSQSLEEALAQ